MIGLIVLAVGLAVETLIFSTPARIPALKRRALSNRVWRWGAIVLLASLPTLVHIFGLMWFTPNIEMNFGNMTDDAVVYELDYELRDDLITELRWRTFVPWDNGHCFTGIVEVCDTADKWQAFVEEQAANQQSYDRSLSDWLTNLAGFGLFLIPSYCVGYAVYRITHDTRKQKHG